MFGFPQRFLVSLRDKVTVGLGVYTNDAVT